MRVQVEIIRYNGRLMFRHPVLETLVLAPEGSKLGQRLEIELPRTFPPEILPPSPWEQELPLDWEDRPKL